MKRRNPLTDRGPKTGITSGIRSTKKMQSPRAMAPGLGFKLADRDDPFKLELISDISLNITLKQWNRQRHRAKKVGK